MLEADEPARRLERHSDCVEAQLRRMSCDPARAVGEPLTRHIANLSLLAVADRHQRAVGTGRASDHTRLHLAEDEATAVARDDVELAIPRTEVPVDHGVA